MLQPNRANLRMNLEAMYLHFEKRGLTGYPGSTFPSHIKLYEKGEPGNKAWKYFFFYFTDQSDNQTAIVKTCFINHSKLIYIKVFT